MRGEVEMTQRVSSDSGADRGVRREDWLRDSALSGFVATFAMTVVLAAGYGLARVIGDEQGNQLERWFWGLSHNMITERTTDALVLGIGINLVTGLIWAVIYGAYAEPMLNGSGWRKGITFSLVAWLLSIIVFLPIAGGGLFGSELNAGPLPVLGNLILHLIFGAVLGGVYGIAFEIGLDDTEAERANAAAAERGAALGGAAGVLVGLLLGWALAPQIDAESSRGAISLAGALLGAASGVTAGSFLGMGRPNA